MEECGDQTKKHLSKNLSTFIISLASTYTYKERRLVIKASRKVMNPLEHKRLLAMAYSDIL